MGFGSTLIGPRPVDTDKVKELCDRFVREMKGNRRHYNDAGVAEVILEELQRWGCLTRSTERRLAAWCTTEGSVFQAGVGLAQEISIAIYGHVVREEEFEPGTQCRR